MSLWLEPAVFPVLLDSCVLYPYELRDLLLEAAHEQLYRVHWSPRILEDTVRNLLADGRTSEEQAGRFRAAMEARQCNPARSAQVLLQILSRQAPIFSSRCMEFQD